MQKSLILARSEKDRELAIIVSSVLEDFCGARHLHRERFEPAISSLFPSHTDSSLLQNAIPRLSRIEQDDVEANGFRCAKAIRSRWNSQQLILAHRQIAKRRLEAATCFISVEPQLHTTMFRLPTCNDSTRLWRCRMLQRSSRN